ncbi:hypothetical protein SLT36_20285 [Aminobacter sp. BA135]|uniref:hypothetical protein n=1 Tax=Aminobacter sp. BA135 TaxID=537596 RepID=UPI003D7B6AE1
MLTSEDLLHKLRALPEEKRVFEQAASLPLWDAAYHLVSFRWWMGPAEYESRHAPRSDEKSLAFHRLKAAHPDANGESLSEAIEAAKNLLVQVFGHCADQTDYGGSKMIAC